MTDKFTITRETIGEIGDACDRAERLLDGVPHGIAKAISAELSAIRAAVYDPLPGGERSGCENCDAVLGLDEVDFDEDGLPLCRPCQKGLGEIEFLGAEIVEPVKEGE